MKQFIITVLFFSFIFQVAPVLSADLSPNIMKRVNWANQYLDEVQGQINQGRAEFAGKNIKGARDEYNNISKFYGGSYDPAHPILTALQLRIEAVEQKVKNSQNINQPANMSTSVNNDKPKKLISNISRVIGLADGWLEEVKKNIAKGHDTAYNLNKAKAEYDKIFARYKGMFDPNHPDIVALKARIDEIETSTKAENMTQMGSKPVESGHTILGMSKDMGDKLREVGSYLSQLDKQLVNARKAERSGAQHSGPKLSPLTNYAPLVKRELDRVDSLFEAFNRDFSSQLDPNHAAYIQVKTRVAKAHKDVAKFMADVDAESRSVHKEVADKYQNEVKAIMSTYKNQTPSGKLHAANPGRIVWATQEIVADKQDSIKTRDSFKLTDPIWGRVFLHQSIGNTPIYSSSGDKPSKNDQFRYEFRLFIDGKELVDKFSVFSSGKLQGEAGKSWTTWQFSPNPVPFDDAFKNEADAWRKLTKGLAPGVHKIKIELWGVQGQFKSREPVSVGEFTLNVNKGDRIAAGSKFPDDVHSGGDTDAIRDAMRRAILKPGTEIPVKISVTSDWKYGVYNITKKRYRTISGAILWQDKDHDGVCRFTTYNFVSDNLGSNNWAPLKFKSFCLSCAEGDVECSK